MKFILLLSILFSVYSFGANEKGNGGFIDDMIAAELNERNKLSSDDLDSIVKDKGFYIREKIITKVFEFFLNEKSKNLSKELKKIQKLLLSQKDSLLLDIKVTHIELGQCHGPSACTGKNHTSRPYDSIILDKEALLNSRYGISFSELVGIISHEFLHHFDVKMSNHDSYTLALYMKNLVLTGEYFTKTFEVEDIMISIGNGMNSLLLPSGNDIESFCKINGFSNVVNYRLEEFTAKDFEYHRATNGDGEFYYHNIVYQYDGKYSYDKSQNNNFNFTTVAVQITCSK